MEIREISRLSPVFANFYRPVFNTGPKGQEIVVECRWLASCGQHPARTEPNDSAHPES